MKIQVKIMAILMLFAAFAVIACGERDTTIYAIGDTGPGGGTVFYLADANGLHGLEAAPSGWIVVPPDPASAWSNINSIAIGVTAQGTAIGTGLANSNFIIAQSGHVTSAAKLCRDYAGGGETDWFLPSKDELAAMRSALASTSVDRTTYGFSDDIYWSSSEDNATTAWGQHFDTGVQENVGKSSTTYVRAIRAF